MIDRFSLIFCFDVDASSVGKLVSTPDDDKFTHQNDEREEEEKFNPIFN